MPTIDSPLRYPGGKTQLAPFVRDLAKVNDVHGGVYAEPFAGGAGIAWRLLLNGDMTEVWLNDIDPAISAFWQAVVHNPEPLCERILSTKITIDEWKRQRAVLFENSSNTQERAFATFFLNRTNRSGILKGGVIGGINQTGNYKLDCRFNRDELVNKILRIHEYRDVIHLSQLDAGKCLVNWNKRLPKRSLINIDPPYYTQGKDLYLSFYEHSDHARLAKQVRSLSNPWMLTYDDAPEIEDLYKDLPIYHKGLTYYAQVKRKAFELLVLSKKLAAPDYLKCTNLSITRVKKRPESSSAKRG
ncbi:DNA adenine methylase [Burkholderia gladioli]|uniref:DNA adenine methylase n=1 Tax=Burkholderia gladioli TaxID=28095 RepID=UPI0016408282|nr:DNA adenine methylase [Burkholderia gladioli]